MSNPLPTTNTAEQMTPLPDSAEVAPGVWLPPKPTFAKGVPTGDPLAPSKQYIVDCVYDTLETLDLLLRRASIPYSIVCGTLLGAVRHGGLIPWDSDGDIIIKKEDVVRFLAVADELVELDFNVKPMFMGWKVQAKTCSGLLAVATVDVMVVQPSADGQYLEYFSEGLREMFPNEAVPMELWNSVGDIPFGHLTLQGPSEQPARQYLGQAYGPDWETVAESSTIDHYQRCLVDPVRGPVSTYDYARRSGR